MVFSRTTRWTRRPSSASASAAWPAELAPPTTPAAVFGERERGLAGRVGPADDDRVVTRPELLAGAVGCVGDAEALVVGEARDRQPPVLDAEREDHGTCQELVAVVELESVEAFALGETERAAGNHEADAELVGLDAAAFGEFGAGDAGGEAEVVLDPSRGGGLTADGNGVEDDGGETARGAVHAGR
jgi:hypothetical protein